MARGIPKYLALVIGGALFGIIAGILVTGVSSNQETSTDLCKLIGLIILAFCLIACGQSDYSIWHTINIKRRKHFLKIGILNDIPQNKKEGWAHTNVCQKQWKDEIERQIKKDKRRLDFIYNPCNRINVKLIEVKDNFDSYTAIINPYGGVYPERNLENHETLNKVLDYVAGGGLFINVADIPSYFAYNEKLKRRLEITPPAMWREDEKRGLIVPVKPFDRTPLLEKAGLRAYRVNTTWDIEFEDKYKDFLGLGINGTKVCRVGVVEKNVKPVVKVKPGKKEGEKVTPLFFVEYGEGEFLFSLFWIGVKEQEESIKEKLVTALAKLIVHATQSKCDNQNSNNIENINIYENSKSGKW